MKAHAFYADSAGPVTARIIACPNRGWFNFELSDPDGSLSIYMDNENRDNAQIAAAAFNGDLCELRRLLDHAAPVSVEGGAA